MNKVTFAGFRGGGDRLSLDPLLFLTYRHVAVWHDAYRHVARWQEQSCDSVTRHAHFWQGGKTRSCVTSWQIPLPLAGSYVDEEFENMKAKNIKQTQLISDLKTSIANVVNHFRRIEPHCDVVSFCEMTFMFSSPWWSNFYYYCITMGPITIKLHSNDWVIDFLMYRRCAQCVVIHNLSLWWPQRRFSNVVDSKDDVRVVVCVSGKRANTSLPHPDEQWFLKVNET